MGSERRTPQHYKAAAAGSTLIAIEGMEPVELHVTRAGAKNCTPDKVALGAEAVEEAAPPPLRPVLDAAAAPPPPLPPVEDTAAHNEAQQHIRTDSGTCPPIALSIT